MQERNRSDATIPPHATGMNNLQDAHTSFATNQQLANQAVVAVPSTRARPIPCTLNGNNESDIEAHTSDMPAELKRHVFAGTGRKPRQKQALSRCRKCGKEHSTDPRNGKIFKNVSLEE